MDVYWATKRSDEKHIYSATVLYVGKSSQGQKEVALRVRKVTANSVLHQNHILHEESGIDFVGDFLTSNSIFKQFLSIAVILQITFRKKMYLE